MVLSRTGLNASVRYSGALSCIIIIILIIIIIIIIVHHNHGMMVMKDLKGVPLQHFQDFS